MNQPNWQIFKAGTIYGVFYLLATLSPLATAEMSPAQRAGTELKAMANVCQSSNTLLSQKTQDILENLGSWRRVDPAVMRQDEIDVLLGDARTAEAIRSQVTPDEWKSLVESWTRALLAVSRELEECKERPPLQTEGPFTKIGNNLSGLATPIFFPVMALYDKENRELAMGLWALSPLMAAGGAFELPYNVLAAGPRVVKQMVTKTPCQASARKAEKAIRDFRADVLHLAVRSKVPQ